MIALAIALLASIPLGLHFSNDALLIAVAIAIVAEHLGYWGRRIHKAMTHAPVKPDDWFVRDCTRGEGHDGPCNGWPVHGEGSR